MSTLKGLGQSEGHMGQSPVPLTIHPQTLPNGLLGLSTAKYGSQEGKNANLSGFLTTLV